MVYENNLYRNLMRPLIFVFLILCLILTGIYFGLGYEVDTRTIEAEQKEVVSQFAALNKQITYFTEEIDRLKREDASIEAMYPPYYRLVQETGLEVTLAFYDVQNHLTDFLGKDIAKDSKLQSFQGIINRNVTGTSVSNFIVDRSQSVYIVTRKTKDGFFAVYISDVGLQNVLNAYSNNYVITDDFQKIIAKGANITTTDRLRKFSAQALEESNINYRMTPYESLHIYVVKGRIFTKELYFALLLLLFSIASVFFIVLSRLVRRISQKSSQSIKDLVSQMQQIAQGEKETMELATGDEIEYIGTNINSMVENIKQLTDSNVRLEYEKKVSEFKTMESQFNPHFLYNTLEMISVTAKMDQNLCQRIIFNFTKLLRYSINELSFVRFGEDIEYIDKFLEIQKYKFGDALDFQIEMDPEATAVLIPKLFLQPAIENSIKYGFQTVSKLFVQIKIEKKDTSVRITVSDNGRALPEGKRREINRTIVQKSQTNFFTDEHHGLENMYKRLKLLYKEEMELQFMKDEQVLLQICFKDR